MTQSEVVCPLVQIISDEQIDKVHGSAKFGPSLSPREVVNDGVRKYAVGFQGGSTQRAILIEHGLLCRVDGYKADLSARGKRYARALFYVDRAAREATLAENERLREALGPFAKAGELFVDYPSELVAAVFSPAAGVEYGLTSAHLLGAHQALSEHKE